MAKQKKFIRDPQTGRLIYTGDNDNQPAKADGTTLTSGKPAAKPKTEAKSNTLREAWDRNAQSVRPRVTATTAKADGKGGSQEKGSTKPKATTRMAIDPETGRILPNLPKQPAKADGTTLAAGKPQAKTEPKAGSTKEDRKATTGGNTLREAWDRNAQSVRTKTTGVKSSAPEMPSQQDNWRRHGQNTTASTTNVNRKNSIQMTATERRGNSGNAGKTATAERDSTRRTLQQGFEDEARKRAEEARRNAANRRRG